MSGVINPHESCFWDVPAYPTSGTSEVEELYTAVGLALSEWEEMELDLARLFAAYLHIAPTQALALPEYAEAPRFVDRLAVVQRAEVAFAKRFCDQGLEGEFACISTMTTRASRRRNDIAHGVARESYDPNDISRKTEWVLLPAAYRARRFSLRGAPDFAFNAEIIRRFANGFFAIRAPIAGLRHQVRLAHSS